MKVCLIVAMDEARGIGNKNRLPWRLPDDLQRFKTVTMGHHIVMGRKTYQSIGRALPGRVNIILTRNRSFQAKGCAITHSLEEALMIAKEQGEEEVFVIGGAEIYSEAIAIADRIYLTIVHTQSKTDAQFPKFDPSEWVTISEEYKPSDEANEFSTTFKILEKSIALNRK
jgi:dihydrofolate reductase